MPRLRLQVRPAGQQLCTKVADVVLDAAHCDPGTPAITHLPDAGIPCTVITLQRSVLAVLRPGGWAQVRDPVVDSDAVPVVEVGGREDAVGVQPGESVVLIVLAVDHRGRVPAVAGRAHNGTYGLPALPALEVRELAGQWVVGEEFFESGLSQHGAPISVAIV